LPAVNRKGDKVTTPESAAPLFDAIQARDLASIRSLVEADAGLITDHNDYGHTPLHTAVQVSCPETVEMLLARGSNIEEPETGYGQTPLALAVFGCDLPMVQLLLGHGAAVLDRHLEIVEKGLRGGWDAVHRQYGGVKTPAQYQAVKDVLTAR
jgi:ankyrin repeat protein